MDFVLIGLAIFGGFFIGIWGLFFLIEVLDILKKEASELFHG